MDRDKLLGPPKGHDLRSTSYVAGGAGKRVVGLLLSATLALAIVVAYLIGQNSVEVSNPNVSPAGSQAPPGRIALTALPPFEAVKIEKPVSPKLVLSPISAPDWKKLGMGCACTFEVGKNALFIAGGDDLAIFRPNGERKICSITSEQFTHLYENNEGRVECGGSRITLKGSGAVTPGFDGHRTSAKLTVLSGGQETSLTGRWNCGC